MKRILPLAALAIVALAWAAPSSATRVTVVRHHGPYHRTTVVVGPGWPIHRPARVVIVKPSAVAVTVHPVHYFAPVPFTVAATATVVSVPPPATIIWEDGGNLARDEDWTELTLNTLARGHRLWLDVAGGKVQFDWVEVTFANGEAQVVDFAEKTREPGVYPLLTFPNGRTVDHVRIVARAKSEEARVAVRMAK